MFKVNPLSTNPTKWSNTLKQFVDKLLTNCLSAFDHFVKFVFIGLTANTRQWRRSGVFVVNFEHISHLAQMFLLLTLNM